MAEQRLLLTETANPAMSGDWPAAGSPPVKLACFACKRRKVKCDRQLPTCYLCHKLNLACEYPTHPEKPGPKTGSRNGTKRRRLNASSGNSHSAGSLSVAGEGPPSSFAQPGRRASSLSVGSPAGDSSHRGHDTAVPEDDPSGTHPTNAPIFSRIMYPSHESQTRPQSPSTVHTSPGHQEGGPGITVGTVCDALKIPKGMYDMLMDLYFSTMTAFTLFRPGSIEPKFASMQFHSDAEALVAAMFSFSARHCRGGDCPTPSYFAQVASSRLDESVDRYGDMRPPFWLLQAGILVTFYQLTLSVRSRSWKKLGDCIRYSYDLNLHIVDANHDPTSSARGTLDMQRWILLEERRRAWWAVWEMDVFASTIRRLPTAIDASQNLTMLPVPDNCWFDAVYQESCFLAEDCNLRWKHLTQSGNQSAKAWFIVINSLMRNTQRIVYPAGSAMRLVNEKHVESIQDELDIMANCLYCAVTSLPAHLSYQGETLDFRPKASPHDRVNPRQEHADKYATHVMAQLCRFMIYHHKICARAPWLAHQQQQQPQQQQQQQQQPQQQQQKSQPAHRVSPGSGDSDMSARQAISEWSNYMDASDDIVRVVRNSAGDHYRYVNPFLANTLWFAAAAQCACNVFGPPSFSRRLTGSNLDLLKLTIDRFVDFWGGMETLKGKLARIESALHSLMARPANNGSEPGARAEQLAAGNGPGTNNAIGTSMNSTTPRDPSRSSDSAHVDPGVTAQDNSNRGAVLGTGPLPVVTGMPAHGSWAADPRWPSFVPDLDGFGQPFPAAGQDTGMYVSDPLDFSPFGLEELLMAGVNFQL